MLTKDIFAILKCAESNQLSVTINSETLLGTQQIKMKTFDYVLDDNYLHYKYFYKSTIREVKLAVKYITSIEIS